MSRLFFALRLLVLSSMDSCISARFEWKLGLNAIVFCWKVFLKLATLKAIVSSQWAKKLKTNFVIFVVVRADFHLWLLRLQLSQHTLNVLGWESSELRLGMKKKAVMECKQTVLTSDRHVFSSFQPRFSLLYSRSPVPFSTICFNLLQIPSKQQETVFYSSPFVVFTTYRTSALKEM